MWGDENDTIAILVDGVAVQIRRNLFNVLAWHRGWRPKLPIWADAVCINQGDPEEKGHQIMQMGRVYREATKVMLAGRLDTNMEALLHWGVRLHLQRGNKAAFKYGVNDSQSITQRAWWTIFRAKAWCSSKAGVINVLTLLQSVQGAIEFHRLDLQV